MRPGARLQDGWKILIAALVCVTSVFFFLVALASPGTGDGEDQPGQTPGLSSPEVPEGQSMGGMLRDFQFIPGSAVMVDATHVLAMFQNPEKEFYAVALFTATCDGQRGTQAAKRGAGAWPDAAKRRGADERHSGAARGGRAGEEI